MQDGLLIVVICKEGKCHLFEFWFGSDVNNYNDNGAEPHLRTLTTDALLRMPLQ